MTGGIDPSDENETTFVYDSHLCFCLVVILYYLPDVLCLFTHAEKAQD